MYRNYFLRIMEHVVRVKWRVGVRTQSCPGAEDGAQLYLDSINWVRPRRNQEGGGTSCCSHTLCRNKTAKVKTSYSREHVAMDADADLQMTGPTIRGATVLK